MKLKLIHLPNSRYTIEYNGKQCDDTANYSQRGIFCFGTVCFVAQTQYWGCENVWSLGNEIPFESIDNTLTP